MYGMHGMNGGGWFLPMLMPLLFAVLLVVIAGLFFWFLSKHSPSEPRRPHSSRSSETPIEILEKRYARGEITTEEFKRMKTDLE